MSDRWGGWEDTAKLRERISVIETNLPLIRADMERQFRDLAAGQNANRRYSEERFEELALLIKSSAPARNTNSSDRLFWAIVLVGAVVTAVGILVISSWIITANGGSLV